LEPASELDRAGRQAKDAAAHCRLDRLEVDALADQSA
jgi:hypothetical protein